LQGFFRILNITNTFTTMATSEAEVKKLRKKGWVLTDSDCNQLRFEVEPNQIYTFREDRLIDPETGETEVYESDMNINDYVWTEIVDACESFGYDAQQVDKWLSEGEEIDLILECLFELES
jgi:hypothetical protein